MVKKCPNCGTDNKDNATFCKDCGTKLDELQKKTSTKDEKPTSTSSGRFDPGVLLRIGGILAGVALIAAAVSTVMFFIGILFNVPPSNYLFLASLIGIFSSVVLVLIGIRVVFIGLEMKLPGNFGYLGYLIFFFFVLAGIGSIVSAQPVDGVLLIFGGMLIIVAVHISIMDTREAKVSAPIVAIIGVVMTFLGFVTNPAYSNVFSAGLISGTSLFIFPPGIYNLFGFIDSYSYIGFVSVIIVLVVSIFYAFDMPKKAKDVINTFIGIGLILFSAGELINGYFLVNSGTLRNFSIFKAMKYNYIFQAFQGLAISTGVLMAISGLLLLVGSVIYVAAGTIRNFGSD
ncbi:MAG: zinc ribbon domain-containing protein [Thermoplasmataceae archaeon]